MLGELSRDSLAPEAKAGGFEARAHELDDLSFGQAAVLSDVIKGGAVFPCHSDDDAFLFLGHGGL